MGRSVAIVLPSCLVAFALVAGGAACDSSLNLGTGAGADATAAPESGPPTCEGTCERLIDTCALFTPDKRQACLAECYQKGSASDLACVAQTACRDIAKVCGDGTTSVSDGPDGSVTNDFEIRTCQSRCDSSQFFDCLTAAELSICRDLCATAPPAKRNAYAACATGGGGDCPKSHDCYDLFTKD